MIHFNSENFLYVKTRKIAPFYNRIIPIGKTLEISNLVYTKVFQNEVEMRLKPLMKSKNVDFYFTYIEKNIISQYQFDFVKNY